jgi:uncharacterized membrane protein SpoIIM required for sporulation/ABC-type Na+ efflux pump permease subunit
MQARTILGIMRREVRETLTDWRVLIPIIVLSLVFPNLLVIGVRLIVNITQDMEVASALIPFIGLLVGFIPASFSLIGSLESFVGERERNTLESLLAMPATDRQLYIGKLLSALFTPILASYTAICVFLTVLYNFYPRLYFAGMDISRLLLIVLLSGSLAFVMVSACVLISSKSTSLRAANLFSSLVLLPAALIVQGEAFLAINNLWSVLWLIAAALVIAGIVITRIGLQGFSRESILSREHNTVKLFQAKQAVQASQTKQYRSRHHLPQAVTIGLREVTDTITDWRILLPIFILSVLVPSGLVAALPFAISFITDQSSVERLVPFSMLLVGFIPSTFSLLGALESFVGERERNTLESLLAMPVSDTQLYLGKFVSSLFTPLLTSYMGMLVFSVGVMATYPNYFWAELDLGRIGLLIAMIGAMTCVMVAGAVIISSHTSSIRAATLLASIILLPMSTALMSESILIIARRWDIMVLIVYALIVIAVALIRTGLFAFNREELLSREHEQLSLGGIARTFKTFFREYHSPGVVPNDYEGKTFSIKRFYNKELWQLLADNRIPLAIALLSALVGLVGGATMDSQNSLFLSRLSNGLLDGIGAPPDASWQLSILIFFNNLRVSMLAPIASIFSFGLFSFAVPSVAFWQIGFVSKELSNLGGAWLEMGTTSPLQFILAYVLPHGVIELPAFLLSAGLGIRLGVSLLAPPKGFSVGQHVLWSIANYVKVWIWVILPMVFIGSMIEGFITPNIVKLLY